jgi:hypothetical protein
VTGILFRIVLVIVAAGLVSSQVSRSVAQEPEPELMVLNVTTCQALGVWVTGVSAESACEQGNLAELVTCLRNTDVDEEGDHLCALLPDADDITRDELSFLDHDENAAFAGQTLILIAFADTVVEFQATKGTLRCAPQPFCRNDNGDGLSMALLDIGEGVPLGPGTITATGNVVAEATFEVVRAPAAMTVDSLDGRTTLLASDAECEMPKGFADLVAFLSAGSPDVTRSKVIVRMVDSEGADVPNVAPDWMFGLGQMLTGDSPLITLDMGALGRGVPMMICSRSSSLTGTGYIPVSWPYFQAVPSGLGFGVTLGFTVVNEVPVPTPTPSTTPVQPPRAVSDAPALRTATSGRTAPPREPSRLPPGLTPTRTPLNFVLSASKRMETSGITLPSAGAPRGESADRPVWVIVLTTGATVAWLGGSVVVYAGVRRRR